MRIDSNGYVPAAGCSPKERLEGTRLDIAQVSIMPVGGRMSLDRGCELRHRMFDDGQSCQSPSFDINSGIEGLLIKATDLLRGVVAIVGQLLEKMGSLPGELYSPAESNGATGSDPSSVGAPDVSTSVGAPSSSPSSTPHPLCPQPQSPVFGPRTPYRSDISNEFLFKPESDKDGKLAILIPAKFQGQVEKVLLKSKSGKTLHAGKYAGVGNGGREHYRFSRAGRQYPKDISVEFRLKDGRIFTVSVPDPSKRKTV